MGKNYEKRLTKRVALSILAEARKFTPLDLGHLRDENKLKEGENGEYSLVNTADYSKSQYEDVHHHLIESGIYKSISRASVGIGKYKEIELKKLKNKAKFKFGYWEKFRILMNLGELTPQAARWFHLAADEVEKHWNEEAQTAFVEEARELEIQAKGL
jgi:hypothetical protein